MTSITITISGCPLKVRFITGRMHFTKRICKTDLDGILMAMGKSGLVYFTLNTYPGTGLKVLGDVKFLGSSRELDFKLPIFLDISISSHQPQIQFSDTHNHPLPRFTTTENISTACCPRFLLKWPAVQNLLGILPRSNGATT